VGEKKLGRWLCFKGSGKEGGPEGGQRGGCHVQAEWEREREREGGLATVHVGGVFPRDSGERRGRGDAGRCGRQVGRSTTGARSSAARCGAWQRGEVVGAALTGGVGSTVRPIQFSN
jgi:hypothetical protein